MVREKHFRCSKSLGKQPPKPTPAHLGSLTGKSLYRSLWVFWVWFAYDRLDVHPVPNCGHLSKRDSCLHHAPRPGIHSHEQDTPWPTSILLEIGAVPFPSVPQYIVGNCNWQIKAKVIHHLGQ